MFKLFVTFWPWSLWSHCCKDTRHIRIFIWFGVYFDNNSVTYKHTQETDEQDWKYFYFVCVFNFLTILITIFNNF